MSAPPLLRPLVRPTPGQGPHLPPEVRRSFRERFQQAVSRECRERLLGDPAAALLGGGDPTRGWHESTAATRQWTAAVLFPHPVGIALEPVRHRSQEHVRQVTDHGELELLGGFRWQHFARLCSAKLALLRRTRLPLDRLPDCRLVAVAGPRGLVVQHGGLSCYVHQVFRRGCYASVCAERSETSPLCWDWRESPAIGELS